MRLLIDADGCPVVRIAADCANRHNVPVTLVCDSAHLFNLPGVDVITVTKGADSADFRLVNLLLPGDVVVTQDYGLAAMCLARRAVPLNQNGLIYTDANIDSLHLARHTSRKLRSAGVRMKGPAKRTSDQDRAFLAALEGLLGAQNPTLF